METIAGANSQVETTIVTIIVLILVSTLFLTWCFASFFHEVVVAKRLRSKPNLVSRQMTDLFWLPARKKPMRPPIKIHREATRL